MNKLKIVVYAITKNEEKFVNRWVESMREADEIVVLDTGSTDRTVEKLQQLNVKVKTKVFSPWRFDDARNESLQLVPLDTDVCVCTDLDEVFDKGWRKEIEKVWIKNQTTQLKYIYVWNTLSNGKDGVTFLYEKIHARNNFEWIYPVHEILSFKEDSNNNINNKISQTNFDLKNKEIASKLKENNIKQQEKNNIKEDNKTTKSTFTANNSNQNIVVNQNIILRHFPDPTKSRSQYLNLLELSVKEYPNSDRNTHYLAREYYFNKKYFSAIKMFKRHLKMPTSTWQEERSASYNYLGDCYLCLFNNLKNKIKNINKKIITSNGNLKQNNSNYISKNITNFDNNFLSKINNYQNKLKKYKILQKKYLILVEKYYKKAIIESSSIRESFYNLANFYYYIKRDYINCLLVLNSMLTIQNKTLSYMTNPNCWNEYPFDLLSMCYYKTNNYLSALINCQKAMQINPTDTRIKNNLVFFNKCLINNKN